jgi:hypothetical protein
MQFEQAIRKKNTIFRAALSANRYVASRRFSPRAPVYMIYDLKYDILQHMRDRIAKKTYSLAAAGIFSSSVYLGLNQLLIQCNIGSSLPGRKATEA